MRYEKLRSFPTKCKYCGGSILYWESTAGQKVFFNLPIYGRPIVHRCNKRQPKKSYILESNKDHLLKKIEKTTYQCPVCNKILNTESALNSHINKLRKQDDQHSDFFDSAMDLLVWDDSTQKNFKEMNMNQYKTKHSLDVMNERFILKTKGNKEEETFDKFIRLQKFKKN
ncbi:MAG: hypothetical protein ACTSWX_15890 [Promethearchaeota archaeon]